MVAEVEADENDGEELVAVIFSGTSLEGEAGDPKRRHDGTRNGGKSPQILKGRMGENGKKLMMGYI